MFLFKNMVNNPYPYESQIVSKYSAIENYFAHADKINMVVITCNNLHSLGFNPYNYR